MDKNSCQICKIRAYIACDICEDPIYFCSRGHLHSHNLKVHRMTRSNSNSTFNTIRTNQNNNNNTSLNNHKNDSSIIKNKSNTNTNLDRVDNNTSQIDLRKLFAHLQNYKTEIEIQIKDKNYAAAISNINKCLSMSKKFYQENDLFVKLIFKISI